MSVTQESKSENARDRETRGQANLRAQRVNMHEICMNNTCMYADEATAGLQLGDLLGKLVIFEPERDGLWAA